MRYPARREATVNDDDLISRRRFAELGATAATGLGLVGLSGLTLDAQQGRGASGAAPQPTPRPEALKSEFLMDLILETAPAVTIGSRTVVGVTGGTFEGPKLKGKVVGPGADWPMRMSDTLRILDVRTILVTDDDQKIYMTYRGVIRMPAAGQPGERYWRTTPIFETDSKKYEWITQMVAVGVSYTVPQRVAYRIFEIV
jgi:Protein of unknown function (DUF3237)